MTFGKHNQLFKKQRERERGLNMSNKGRPQREERDRVTISNIVMILREET